MNCIFFIQGYTFVDIKQTFKTTLNEFGFEHNRIQTDHYNGIILISLGSTNISKIKYCGYFPSISTSPARGKFVGWKGIILYYELN